MSRAPGAGTRVFALLGEPVEHSLSPAIQNAALRAAGRDGVYVALRCDARAMSGLLEGLARAGGGGNVTLPHKQAAAETVDRRTEAVTRTGACNTFWLEGSTVWGDNTDVEGLRRAASDFLPHPLAGRRVLLLGAGGAARAALSVLVDEAADEVVVWNRTVERAHELAERLGGGRTRVVPDREALRGERFDLVLNATRLGLEPSDPLPLDPGTDVETGALLDLVYRPGGTALVRRARELGLSANDGREMLLHQGAAAYERWWGEPAPLAAMREALSTATGGR